MRSQTRGYGLLEIGGPVAFDLRLLWAVGSSVESPGSRREEEAMDLLLCLWLLALMARLDGRDTCGLCTKISKPALPSGQRGWTAARHRS